MTGRLLAATLLLTIGAGAGEIVVKVEGVRNAKGKVRALLFTKAEGFPNEPGKAVANVEAVAKAGAVTLKFALVDAVVGAIVVIHDEDADGKMRKNLLGVPKEGVTATAWDGKGKPRFAGCVTKFEIGKAVVLRMKYF